jgi:hypothetical protein|tara:strand:+ start:272 stop:664 length:393 start_codon:yes stop_codon:yes gene_type:complete
MAIDYEIFEGKSLSSLFKDIYDNTEYNKKQLDILTKELVQFIKDGDTAVQLVPMIKEYLEINVKNDDQLVKMAGIVQRLISAENKAGSENEFGLSEEEKTQLLAGMEDTIKDIQIESDKIQNRIESVKGQ